MAVVAGLADLRIKVKIGEGPNEVPDPIRFGEDRTHAAYDPEYARRFWRILLQVDRLFKLFRTGFIGKCSPVHFFWGSFDLAVTRFSGRPAPVHPGGIPNLSDEVVREAIQMKAIIADKRTNCGLPADANVWHQPHNSYLLNIG